MRVESERAVGRALVPAIGALALALVSLAILIRTGINNFWPLFGCVVGLGAAGDRLLASRQASITVDGDELRVQTRVESASRKATDLMTVEWHERGWRDVIVLNFSDYDDNIEMTARGFKPEQLKAFAESQNRPFLQGEAIENFVDDGT